jgi:hypothetical protein
MTAQVVILSVAGVLIVAGIIGGGIEVKEMKIPKMSMRARVLSVIVGLVLLGGGLYVSPSPTPEPHGPDGAGARPPGTALISVKAGTYGGNCHAPHGNVTDYLRSECDGRSSCSYEIDFHKIGDPVPFCSKDYLAEWTCGNDLTIRRASASAEAGIGTRITLNCE